MGNSYNSQYYDLDRNIQETSMFGGLSYRENDENFINAMKKLMLTMAFVGVSAMCWSHSYISDKLSNDKAYQSGDKKIETVINDYKEALTNDGLFTLANKLGSLTAPNFDKQREADKIFQRKIHELMTFSSVEGLKTNAQLMIDEKDKLIKEYNIKEGTQDYQKIMDKFNSEYLPLKNEIDVINKYNNETLQYLKDKKMYNDTRMLEIK